MREIESNRNFEKMHISRTLDTFKRNFSKKLPSLIDEHLSKLKVDFIQMTDQMTSPEMKNFSTNLEDYLFEFEEDFKNHLDKHII